MADVINKDGKYYEKSDDGKYHEIPKDNFVNIKETTPSTFTEEVWKSDADIVSKGVATVASVAMDVTITPFLKIIDAVTGSNDGKK